MFSLPRVSRKTIFVLLFLGIIQVSCTNHSSPAQSFAERACIDSLVRANRNLDSMEIWLEKFSREQNHIGLIFVCRELGKRYREKSRFSEALAIHNRGLRLAIELADTLEIADAYNNIGTDLRRMGMLSEAADSHYLALHIAEQYTGNEPRQNRKNYVYALNGLGNIYKALDNRNEAEHYFRRALKIETEMGNELGQAINWANLGSIYKYRQQYDSAYLCFTRSLEHNERARSKLGIALCHTHFGQIHECRGDYEQAFGEYNISYRLLKAIPDKWNLLKSCTALASLHFRRGNLPKAKKILDEALITAREIHSFGHLEELHLLRSEYYERLGICRNALHELKLSHQYRDSLLTDQNESMVYETQIRYERDKKAREIAELNEQNERQIRSRRQVTITSGIVILLTFMILGVLVYALRMNEKWERHAMEPEKQTLYGPYYYEVTSDSPWNYCLPKANVRPEKVAESFVVEDAGEMAPYPWTPDGSPVKIRTQAHRIGDWTLHGGSAGPIAFVSSQQMYMTSEAEWIELIPYGCTTLRVTEFPVR